MANILINILESSSNGNCIVLNDQKSFLILDFGVSNTIWNNAIKKLNIQKNKIAGILLTHYHVDHIRTIKDNYYNNVNVYTCKATLDFIKENYNVDVNAVALDNQIGKWIKIRNSSWKIKAYKTIHNAKDSLCFVIKNKTKQIVYLTDTKYFTNNKLRNKNAYIIEAPFGLEFDIENNFKMSTHFKKDQNHLSLKESVMLFNQYVTSKTKLFIFSHLNPNVSDFNIIENTTKKLSNKKLHVTYIKPKEILKRSFEI